MYDGSFDEGFMIGNFFCSFIINELFCGFNFRIGKEDIGSECAYHITIQIGYGQLAMGFLKEVKNEQ